MRPRLPANTSARWIIGVIALAVALNVVALLFAAVRPEPSGQPGSGYATQPRGAAAYAEVLRRSGREVRFLRKPLAEARLDPATTLVVLEPRPIDGGDRAALTRFVRRGGRLIAGGVDPGSLVRPALARPPRWSARGALVALASAPVPEIVGVRSIRSSGVGGFEDPGGTLPALGQDPALLVVARAGAGRMLLLADPTPLQNRLLARADNAALGLGLAGPQARPVVFVESVHGFGESTGLAALPKRWLWALVGTLLAGLVWMLARARRLGPAEQGAQPAAPARREYVDALALALRRSGEPGTALEPVRLAAREQVLRRAALAPGAPDAAVREAALAIGYDADEAAALTGEIDEARAMAVGRALAKGRR